MSETTAQELNSLSDAELTSLYNSTDDDGIRAAIESVCARRDRKDAQSRKDAARWAAVYEEWVLFAHAQFLAAEAATNGYMLRKEYRDSDIDPWSFWTGSDSRIRRYASEELIEFFDTHTRLTVSQFRDQQRREARAEREANEN